MNKKQNMILVITNGAGLGHLTRGLAVAKRLRTIAPWLEIIFFTTCEATEVIRKEGFVYFYVPSKGLLPEQVNATTWVTMLKNHLEEIIQMYNPIGIVFEGAYPCGAIISHIKAKPQLKSVWLKRESNKSDPKCLKELEESFNMVIVPKEAGKSYSANEQLPKNKYYCSPIVLIDEEEAHDRQQVRKILDVKRNEKLFYIQLGNDDMQKEGVWERVQRSLVGQKNTKLLVAESIIGAPIVANHPNIKIIRNYPNAQYFKAVDFAITQAGYNTYHEMVYFTIPTLFIPNMQTVLDDQMKRAMYLERRGAALCLRDVNRLNEAINHLQSQRKEIIDKLTLCKEENGAIEAAKLIEAQMKGDTNK